MKPPFAIIDGRCRDDMRDEQRLAVGLAMRQLEWEDVRAERNRLLRACDWTQLEDAPQSVKDVWKAYRQRLRDLPSMYEKPEDVKWPTPPEK